MRQLGEVDRVLEPGDDHRPHDPVDGLLVEPPQGDRGGLGARHARLEPVVERGLGAGSLACAVIARRPE